MFNKVILGGYMVSDILMKYTPQGTPVATLRLAVNSGKNKNGRRRPFSSIQLCSVRAPRTATSI